MKKTQIWGSHVLIASLCVSPIVGASCFNPEHVSGCDESRQRSNCVGLGGSCGTYTTCPCDEQCQQVSGGLWDACRTQTVTRRKLVYQGGTLSAYGCCYGGMYLGLSDSETCTFTKAFPDGGYCMSPGGTQ